MEALFQFGTSVQAFRNRDANDQSPQLRARCDPPYSCMAMILDTLDVMSMGRLLVLSQLLSYHLIGTSIGNSRKDGPRTVIDLGQASWHTRQTECTAQPPHAISATSYIAPNISPPASLPSTAFLNIVYSLGLTNILVA
jgi:hypothetical protein